MTRIIQTIFNPIDVGTAPNGSIYIRQGTVEIRVQQESIDRLVEAVQKQKK